MGSLIKFVQSFSKVEMFAFCCFLYIFPIYPIISFEKRIGNLPSFPFTLLLHVIPCFFLFIYFVRTCVQIRKIDKQILLFLLTVFGCILYLYIYVFIQHEYIVNRELTIEQFLLITYFLLIFTLGLYIGNIEKYSRIILYLFIFNSLLWLYYTDFSHLMINFSLIKDEEMTAIYLEMGKGYATLSMLALYVTKKRRFLSLLITLVSIMVLFFINSRASLYIYILTLIFPMIYYQYYRLAIVVGCVLLFFLLPFFVDMDMLMNSRVLRLILHLDQDTSLHARNLFMQQELSALWEHWFWGDYFGYYKRWSLGGYIHNYLSFWAQYGLIPFIMICFLIFYSLKVHIRYFFKYKEKVMFQNMVFLYALVLIIGASAYMNTEIWFVLGLTLRMIIDEKSISQNNISVPIKC